MSLTAISPQEATMTEVDLLRLRCCKFTPALLLDLPAVTATLKCHGWSQELLAEHLADAVAFAQEARRLKRNARAKTLRQRRKADQRMAA